MRITKSEEVDGLFAIQVIIMSTEVCVSAEELKQTLEYVSLIGATGGGKGKKKDDDTQQVSGVLRITAASPHKDKSYILCFECLGTSEQLLYRMEGKSYNSAETVSTQVEGWRLAALAKTFDGDVTLRFDERCLGIVCGTSAYKITVVKTELPEMRLPDKRNAITLSVNFLQEAVRHCTPAVVKDDARAWLKCIQLQLRADGSAYCYATDTHRLARYAATNTGSKADAVLLMTPAALQHIIEMCDQNEITLIPTERYIYASTPRYDWLCYKITGRFPNCEEVFKKHKPLMSITVNRRKMLGAISRASIVSDNNCDNRINLASDTQALYIESASVAGSGLDSVPVETFDGSDDEAYAVSAFSLNKLLSACASENVSITTHGKLLPLLICVPGSENGYLLAGMR